MLVNSAPGYIFNEAECRYYYASNGKPVSERRLESMVKRMRSHYEQQVNNLTREAMEGVLSQEVFVDAMRSTMKSAAINFAALGVGGHSRLTFTEYGRVGGYLSADYRRLTTFSNALYTNELSYDQAQVRSALYVGHQQDNFYKSRCIPQGEEGFVFIEKRTLGNRVNHCPDCIDYHQRGWSQMGALPPPGTDSVCGSACGCTLERRKIPSRELNQWLTTRRSR